MTALLVPKKTEHRREWIKYQLRIVDSSFSSIAEEVGVTRQTVQSVMVKPYPKMQEAIARKIGIAPEIIWPERYESKNSNTMVIKGKKKRA